MKLKREDVSVQMLRIAKSRFMIVQAFGIIILAQKNAYLNLVLVLLVWFQLLGYIISLSNRCITSFKNTNSSCITVSKGHLACNNQNMVAGSGWQKYSKSGGPSAQTFYYMTSMSSTNCWTGSSLYYYNIRCLECDVSFLNKYDNCIIRMILPQII